MTVPSVNPGFPPPPNDDLIKLVSRLQAQVDELSRRTLYSASISKGGLTVRDGGKIEVVLSNGVKVFYVGETTNGIINYNGIIFRRPDGSTIFATFPIGVDPNNVAWALYDHLHVQVLSSDAATGGMARPWLQVPMVPRFSGGNNVLTDYYNIAASEILTQKTTWSTTVGLISHPYIQLDGIWGTASGANTCIYRLKLNGVQVGTWTTGGLEVSTKGPFNISAFIESGGVGVDLTCIATGTGQVAAHVNGCWQRQT